ncbi:MAG: hypothetical protein JW829_15670 [Pirellulales bacterium]|nr:hypothetical protein [Pirellulales bacterium]
MTPALAGWNESINDTNIPPDKIKRLLMASIPIEMRLQPLHVILTMIENQPWQEMHFSYA